MSELKECNIGGGVAILNHPRMEVPFDFFSDVVVEKSGGPPSWDDLEIATPPPILHPLDTNTSHLIPPVHKDWPLEA